MQPPILPNEARRRVAHSHLKQCPLCEALNARSNEACFVCGWRGRFDHDPRHLEASLIELIGKCPDLEDVAG